MRAVFGCGDFDPPDGASLQRSGDDAVVVCNKTGETWYVTCRDGVWIGAVGNCTKFGIYTHSLDRLIRCTRQIRSIEQYKSSEQRCSQKFFPRGEQNVVYSNSYNSVNVVMIVVCDPANDITLWSSESGCTLLAD